MSEHSVEWNDGYLAGRVAAAKDLENYLLGLKPTEWNVWKASLVVSGDII